MDTGPRIDSYEWAGGREAMLRFGPDEGPVVVLALPLFEEANRCRAFGVSILRALGGRGVGGVLPELPGQGESTVGLATTTLLLQQEAVEQVVAEADATGRRCYAVGIRSGALLDLYGLFLGRWHLAPQQGGDLVRELLRTAKASGAVPRDGNLYRLTGRGSADRHRGKPDLRRHDRRSSERRDLRSARRSAPNGSVEDRRTR